MVFICIFVKVTCHSPQPRSDAIFKFNWCYAVVYQMHHDLDS